MYNSVAHFFTAKFWSHYLQKPLEMPYFWPTTLLVVVIFFSWIIFLKKSHCIALFQSTSGQINLSRGALRALISNICTQLGVHDRPKVTVKYKNKKIHLNIKLKMRFDQNVGQITTDLQSYISQALQENLRIKNLGDINIDVSGFKLGTKKQIKTSKSTIKEKSTPEIEEDF